MSDQDDDSQHYALMVLAGVVGLVIAGVIALAVSTVDDDAMAVAATPAAAVIPAAAVAPAAVAAPAAAMATEPDGRVYFESASEAVPSEAAPVLARVADAARANATRIVEISGYHDASGDPVKNAELAKGRALAVRDALAGLGVPADRLVMDKPIVSTGDGNAREARRVELRVR